MLAAGVNGGGLGNCSSNASPLPSAGRKTRLSGAALDLGVNTLPEAAQQLVEGEDLGRGAAVPFAELGAGGGTLPGRLGLLAAPEVALPLSAVLEGPFVVVNMFAASLPSHAILRTPAPPLALCPKRPRG